MNETTPAQPSSFWDDEDRFKQIAALLIAVVTVLAAIIGLLQNDASARDDLANRKAQQFALQAMGLQVAGAAQFGYDYSDAYRNWSELNTQALSAQNSDDEAAASRYRVVAEQIISQSQLLAPRYFDPANDTLKLASYEADTYLVEVTRLREYFATWFDEKQAWDTKANTYVVHLTILAVSLFLFGLAMTLNSRLRWLFVASGLLISSIAVIWAAMLFTDRPSRLSDQAIDAYAKGVGLAHQDEHKAAVASFNEALRLEPGYAKALFELGSSHFALQEYADATKNFEAARAAGRNDMALAWNLGWAYYVQGRFDEAAQISRQALEKDAGAMGIRFNLAVTLLASGQFDAAKAEYTNTLAMAAKEVADAKAAGKQPPGSLWWLLDSAAADLDALLDQFEGENDSYWSLMPPREKITDAGAVKTAAEQMLALVKNASVALETTGQPPVGPLAATIKPFEFGHQPEYNEAGEIVDYTPLDTFPPNTDQVIILFEYAGMQDGQEVFWKVYHNGEEDPSWRSIESWSMGPEGQAYFPISYAYSNVYTLAPGEYVVEMYVNAHLAQRGRFTIEQ